MAVPSGSSDSSGLGQWGEALRVSSFTLSVINNTNETQRVTFSCWFYRRQDKLTWYISITNSKTKKQGYWIHPWFIRHNISIHDSLTLPELCFLPSVERTFSIYTFVFCNTFRVKELRAMMKSLNILASLVHSLTNNSSLVNVSSTTIFAKYYNLQF